MIFVTLYKYYLLSLFLFLGFGVWIEIIYLNVALLWHHCWTTVYVNNLLALSLSHSLRSSRVHLDLALHSIYLIFTSIFSFKLTINLTHKWIDERRTFFTWLILCAEFAKSNAQNLSTNGIRIQWITRTATFTKLLYCYAYRQNIRELKLYMHVHRNVIILIKEYNEIGKAFNLLQLLKHSKWKRKDRYTNIH